MNKMRQSERKGDKEGSIRKRELTRNKKRVREKVKEREKRNIVMSLYLHLH